MRPEYEPTADVVVQIRTLLALNKIRVVARVQSYVSLVSAIRDQYALWYVPGRGLWDQTSERQVTAQEILKAVHDPEGLLAKIKNLGGSNYRVEERVFLIVARAFCESVGGAGTLGAIATLRPRDKVCKHLKSYKWD